MSLAFDLEKITAAMASASLDSTQWNAAMEAVSVCTGSFGAAMFPVEGPLAVLPASDSLAAAFDAYVRNGWIQRDERYRGRQQLIDEGVYTDSDFISYDEIRKHPYYQEFLAPCGLQSFAGVRVGRDTGVWCLSIQRTSSQGPFSAAQLGALKELSGRLESVATIAKALGFARGDAALTAFDIAEQAALLLDVKGEVVRVNLAAEKLLGPDIRITNRRLRSSSRDASERLDAAIKSLVWAAEMASVPPVAFPREDQPSIVVYLMRNPKLTDSPLSPFRGIVVLADLGARSRPASQGLQTAFGLTPAEARLAAALAAGSDLNAEADRLKLSRETVRHQLKAIFAKTGTHRQGELVSLLSRLLSGS